MNIHIIYTPHEGYKSNRSLVALIITRKVGNAFK
jgi:hypothetical protein